ncbi:MAG: transketolase [Thermodesulfobacteriota bacterium]
MASFQEATHAKAIELVRLSIDMTTAAGSGHPTSAASLAHLVTVLMYAHMRYDPATPDAASADRLVLSEGHACPIVYAAAADLGIAIGRDRRRRMTRDDALRLREIDSEIDGHPNPAEGFPFFPAATGSLGQGLSVAAGLALAARLDRSSKRIFCLMGDGESREGQIWEALDFLVDEALSAVCPIFNCNRFGQSDAVSRQQSAETTAAKLAATGYDVRTIDGHDPQAIRDVLREHAERSGGGAPPLAVVARTVKGWGFPSAQGAGHHGKPLSSEQRERAFAELDATARDVGARWSEGVLEIPAAPDEPAPVVEPAVTLPPLDEALRRFGLESALEKRKLAPRRAYGIALRVLGHADKRVVALDGDVKNSTYAEDFASDPQLAPRFFECRIAEQNMISAAAGLAVAGKVPFASSFGKFVTRAYDQLEMALITGCNLKIMGSHTGVSLAADGPSQMALADVAFFRAYSEVRGRDGRSTMYVLNPADGYAAYALTLAMAAHEGACYLRYFRPDVPFLYGYGAQARFELGGHAVLRRGRDLLLVASGYLVHEARRACDELAARGIEATLLDLYSLPFDGRAVAALADEHAGRVLTVADDYGGSFGSAVADAIAAHGVPARVEQLLVRCIPKSCRTPDDVLRALGLSAHDVVESALRLVGATRGKSVGDAV